MILGALVAAGVEPRDLLAQLDSLGIPNWKIDFETVDRSGISSTYARVQTAHEHAHRHLRDILKIINNSGLNDRVKDRAARIFSNLAAAESRVHNQPVEKIHFHEVGALDAIIDVCGAAIGFDLLGVEQFISSPLRVGFGHRACGLTGENCQCRECDYAKSANHLHHRRSSSSRTSLQQANRESDQLMSSHSSGRSS